MSSIMKFAGEPKVISGGNGGNGSMNIIYHAQSTVLLDFIEKKHASIYCSRENGVISHWVFVDETTKTRTGVIGNTLREAIENARRGEL